MDRRLRGVWRPSTLIVFFLLAFVLGILTERSGWLPTAHFHEPPGLAKTFEPFWEAWHLVQQHYVDPSAVNPEHMTEGAIQGMLDSLGDRGHTIYLSREAYQLEEKDLKGELDGIGARMTYRGHQPVIASVIPNSPAQQVGLKPGDALRQVDGKDVSEMPIDRIITLVRGPAGSVVHLRLNREGDSQPLDFEITRARVEVPSVTWHLLPGTPIAHVVLEEFGASTHDQLQSILKEARQAGARGLILDVRNNPGGYKDQAVAVTSMFLKDGNVFIEQDGQGRRTPVPVVPGGEAADLPLVVLINEETGSAAEIFAGAIKDHARGKLIGTQTVGTGTVLMPFELSDGSAVLLAVSQWLTPKGQSIWHEGIKPDVAVALPEGAPPLLPETSMGMTAAELAKSEDKQLLEGLKVVQSQLK